MSAPIVRKEWFSSAELSALGLPGLSTAKRKVNERAEAEGWAQRTCPLGTPLARSRAGRGGGVEYHAAVLPTAARLELVRRGLAPETVADNRNERCEAQPEAVAQPETSESLWDWYATCPAQVKATAERRLLAIRRVEEAQQTGRINRAAAVADVAKSSGIAASTLWDWLARVAGAKRTDWLPMLAPRFSAGAQKTEIPAVLWQYYESWWLRQSLPTHAKAFRETEKEAKRLGIPVGASAKTYRRRAEAIPPEVVALKRGGEEAARLLVPALERSVADYSAMQIVNGDGHKWDVGVRFPDGTQGRVITVAIQDVYSRKFLAWRHGRSESATLVRLAFMDLFRKWGFPQTVLLDNGRAGASKWITGGLKNRYRFSIKEDDPLGLLPRFGIDVIWALPRRGSSKPIERGFRDFAKDIATHPAFDGAWLGNTVANKPENYGSRLVDYDEFVRVVDAEIAEHNAREGRETEMAKARGLSLDAVFAESYANTPITVASEAQLRECMLSAERVRGHRETGAVTFMDNQYWTPGMAELAGKPLVIRYDPDNLHSEVHVCDARGAFLLKAPIWHKAGFLTEDHGRARMKIERDLVKNARKEAQLRDLLTAQELAHRALQVTSETEDTPRPKIVRPVRVRGSAAAVAAAPAPEVAPEFMDRFVAAQERRHLRLIAGE